MNELAKEERKINTRPIAKNNNDTCINDKSPVILNGKTTDGDKNNKRYYYSVRRGKFVNSCIFLHWKDCQVHVEGFPNAEYDIFSKIDDAFDYVDSIDANGWDESCVDEVVCGGKQQQDQQSKIDEKTSGIIDEYEIPLSQLLRRRERTSKSIRTRATAMTGANKRKLCSDQAAGNMLNTAGTITGSVTRAQSIGGESATPTRGETNKKIDARIDKGNDNKKPEKQKKCLRCDDICRDCASTGSDDDSSSALTSNKKSPAFNKRTLSSRSKMKNQPELSLLINDRNHNLTKNWEDNFNLLKEYKEKYGTTRVLPNCNRDSDTITPSGNDFDPKYNNLWRWIKAQNNQYKLIQEGKVAGNYIFEEKIRKLKDIGFQFRADCSRYHESDSNNNNESNDKDSLDTNSIATNGVSRTHRKTSPKWKQMLQKCKEYNQIYGTFVVQKEDRQHAELRLWINEQHQQYKRLRRKQKSYLSEEKIKSLEEIGFPFDFFTWDERLEQLRQYREEEAVKSSMLSPSPSPPDINASTSIILTNGGNKDVFHVPPNHPTLGKWYEKIRSQTKLLAKGEPCNITYQQLNQLKAMGFEPEKRRSKQGCEEENEKWEKNFAELQRYKEEHGNCMVPSTKRNELSAWVFMQRLEYKRAQNNKPSKLTVSRMTRLNDLGFVFLSKGKYASWNERMDQLRQYKDEHGHVRVPVNNVDLGGWVREQRREYRNYSIGKPSAMTKERIDQLMDVGFEFLVGKKRDVENIQVRSWAQRFEELKEFKALYGHTIVRQNSGQLGKWVARQRLNYRKLKEGKPSKMSSDQAFQLAGIGFVFNAKTKKSSAA